MIEIINKQRCPIQLVVRSRKKPRAFTTLIVPGRGKSKNRVVLEDEVRTEYIDRLERMGLISMRYIETI